MISRKVLILGGGDVGSAVGHALFVRGCSVLISERPGSTHVRRGMAFIDALYDGAATLEGVQARHVPDMQGVELCWAAADAIPVVTLAEELLTAACHYDVVIDATMKRDSVRQDLRKLAGFSAGLGPGYVAGGNCDVAIETQWGPAMGSVLHAGPTAARSGGPYALAGITRERFGIAPCAGTWRTAAVLGQAVRVGDPVGHLGAHCIAAPIAGQLRGLTRDGAEVVAGQRVLEVDPRPEPEITGLGERPMAIARGVVEALASAFNTSSGTL